MSHQSPASALSALPEITERLGKGDPAFFLDFDGTLSPIVVQPEMADLLPEARPVLTMLAEAYPTCIVSGRPLDFLQERVGLETVFYAADHGHRISGPPDSGVDLEVGPDDSGELETASRKLRDALRGTTGVLMEPKEVSLAVHYRKVAQQDRPLVRDAVHGVLQESSGLKLMEGKMVYELMPDISWGKGQAVAWLLNYLRPLMTEVFPICVGDDITDEDMFRAVKGQGVSILVGDPQRPTQADYRLSDPSEVPDFLRSLASSIDRERSARGVD